MSGHCTQPQPATDPRYRRALWIALAINAAMFVIEIAGGLQSTSTSLLADSVDFLGDAANYGLSLAVLGMGMLWRSRTALVKGASMAAFGVFVFGRTAWSCVEGVLPEPAVMGVIGIIALLANLGTAALLYAWRNGDANMRSVWLCTRNDALGNIAVMLAAFGVFGTGSGWPDWLVAAFMALLALGAAFSVIRQANGELKEQTAPAHLHEHRHAYKH